MLRAVIAVAAAAATGLGGVLVSDVAVAAPVDTGLVAWGDNNFGSAGVGSGDDTINTPTSIAVPPGVTITSVVSGFNDGAAVASNGTAWTWGENGAGQLGNGTTNSDPNPTPVEVQSPPGVIFTRIAVGVGFMVGLDSTGAVWAWGDNTAGQLGNGTIVGNADTPQPVVLPPGVTGAQIAVGDRAGYVLTADGTMYSWGADDVGQLGIGSTTGDAVPTPTEVAAPAGVTFESITTRGSSVYARGSDGGDYVWGDNISGNLLLADQSELFANAPELVGNTTGTAFVQFALGGEHSLALGANGVLYAWGDNEHGELGIGTEDNDNHLEPVAVHVPAGVTFTQLFASYDANLAVASDGTIYAWGNGDDALLADGPTDDILVPTIVPISEQYHVNILSFAVFTILANLQPEAPHITTASVPNAVAGTPYSATISATGTPPLSFAVTAGFLPAGLTLDPTTGTISGTPTTANDPAFTVTVSNAQGSASQAFSITVRDARRRAR
jgi:alpha-tubulin suppressor-like RCC1 family protein